MFIITFQEPKLILIDDLIKKIMLSHRGTWYTDTQALAKILGLEAPQSIPFERNLSNKVCKCYKTFYHKLKNS